MEVAMKRTWLFFLLLMLTVPAVAFWGGPQACKVTADTWIYQFRPDKNYGDGYGWKDITGPDSKATPRIFIGFGGTDIKIGLFKFDLSGLDKKKPVKSAALKLYNCFAGSDAGVKVDAKLITAPWKESAVTYRNRPSAGETLATVLLKGGRNYNDPGKWYSFDVTKAVQAWQKGTPNNGIMLLPQGEYGVDFEFVCKESAGGAERGPKLEVSY
jgi:hypothetical protein